MAQITLNSSGVASSGSLVLQSNGTTTAVTIDSSQCAAFVAGTAAAPAITTSGDTNTGLFFPAADTVGITTGGTERARVDSSGNLGLGVTPISSFAGYKTFQIASQGVLSSDATSNGELEINNNAYRAPSTATLTYINTAAATKYAQYRGEHRWFNAASGTAGTAITFTQSMTLDSGGRLQLGTTSLTGGLMNFGNTASTTSIAHTWADTVYSTYMGFDSTYYMGTMYNAAGREVRLVANSNDSNGKITFYTGGSGTPSERARITDVGNIVFGSTSAGLTNNNAFWISPPAGYFGQNHINGTASGTAYVYFGYNGSGIGTISQNGTTAVAYNTTSDYRLKENVQPLSGALARVAALKPCTYTWKSAPEEIGEGFIAHELAEVCPQAVTGEKDAVNEDGSIKPQSIDTSFLVATLTAAIQEQQAIITQLQADVAALKG